MALHISTKTDGDTLFLILNGKIDSGNAPDVENDINRLLEERPSKQLVLDAKDLSYISSAGLRIILRLRKSFPDIKIIDVNSEVYEIFDMTGFTEMVKIEKAYRQISVEGCELIGSGTNGNVYRINEDTIIKVYKHAESLPDILKERELARKAFVKGIPTAIPYDVVKVGKSYGSVFELLNANSFSQLIAKEPERLDYYVQLYVDLLKKIHQAEFKPDELPDMKEQFLTWTDMIKDCLPNDLWLKLKSMIEAIPRDNHMLHADYHTKNVMMQDGETLLIDMDTICVGHPIFEFAAMFLTYIGFDESTPDNTLVFLGYPRQTARDLWDKTLPLYFNTNDKVRLQELETKAMILGYTRLLRRTLEKKGVDIESYEHRKERCIRHLIEEIPKVDSLVF